MQKKISIVSDNTGLVAGISVAAVVVVLIIIAIIIFIVVSSRIKRNKKQNQIDLDMKTLPSTTSNVGSQTHMSPTVSTQLTPTVMILDSFLFFLLTKMHPKTKKKTRLSILRTSKFSRESVEEILETFSKENGTKLLSPWSDWKAKKKQTNSKKNAKFYQKFAMSTWYCSLVCGLISLDLIFFFFACASHVSLFFVFFCFWVAGLYLDSENSEYIVTEFCDGGSVLDSIRKRMYSLVELLTMALECAKGMEYLEGNSTYYWNFLLSFCLFLAFEFWNWIYFEVFIIILNQH